MDHRESEKLRVEVSQLCERMGIRIRRRLTMEESRKFLAGRWIPPDAVSKSSFLSEKRLDSLPEGSYCVLCGKDLGNQPGVIVEMSGSDFSGYRTICEADYKIITGDAGDAGGGTGMPDAPEPDTGPEPEPALGQPDAPGEPSAEPPDAVDSALAALAAAIKAKNNATAETAAVDGAALVASAVDAARDAAREAAADFMRKQVAEIIRDGVSAADAGDGGADPSEAADGVAAVGDGVAAASNASSWPAKATPAAVEAVERLNAFLSEFSYFRAGVSMRLVNTFARAKDKGDALRAYCEVSQMEDRADLVEKMKSPEFGEVCAAFAAFDPKPLNRRFAVFYGAPGGGKTYAAIDAGKSINGGDVDVVPCSPSMDAADMLYAYRLDYKTGRRGYVPTALLKAMTCGRAVVLDEINLLPMEARMFLQDILDNKDRVHLMGVEIPIRDGFFVIGTMNVETGLGASPLPLPLVDRAAVVREFKTSIAQAAVGAGLC